MSIYTDHHHPLGSGSSIALAFAEHGCQQIYLGDSSLDGLQACRNTIGKLCPSAQVHIQEFDRSSEKSVSQFFSAVGNTLGRIDFAVNVVSQAQERTVPIGHDVDGFDRSFHVYQRGVCVLGAFSAEPSHHLGVDDYLGLSD